MLPLLRCLVVAAALLTTRAQLITREMAAKNATPNLREPATTFKSACACFHLCNVSDYARYRERAPLVTSRQSPWFTYLRAVYHSEISLPFDTSTLSFFYLDSASWRARPQTPANFSLPVGECAYRFTHAKTCSHCHDATCRHKCEAVEPPPQQQCERSQCDLWLPPSSSRKPSPRMETQIMHAMLTHQYTWFDASPSHAPDNTWIEVIRAKSPRYPEGVNGYGACYLR